MKLDTKPALEQIRALRKAAADEFKKPLELTLSTTKAVESLAKLSAKTKEVRELMGRKLQFNLGTSDAERKLASLNRASTAIRNQIDGGPKQARERTEAEQAQSGLNRQLTRYNDLAAKGIVIGESFTTVLSNQAVAAGALNKELGGVAQAIQLASKPVIPPVLGPTRKDLEAINKLEKEAAARVGKDNSGNLLGPIDNTRVTALKQAQAQADATAKAIRQLGQDSQGVNQQMIAAGRTLTTFVTLPVAIAAALAAFNEFRFQEVIQKTRILTNAFDDVKDNVDGVRGRINALRDDFGRLAETTGQSPQAIAEGFYFVASAGGAVANQLSILRVASEGAAIGLGSVEVVADALTSAVNAYGEANLTAASAGDILVQAVNDAKVEAADFAPQLGRLLPIASNLSIGFDQVSAAMARLTQNGNSAQVASTQLRGVLQTLIRPTSNAAKQLLQSVGLDTEQLRDQIANGGPTALIDVLDRLRKDSGLTLEQLSTLFRRVDAFQGFLSLTDDAEKTRQVFLRVSDAAKNTTGDLDEFSRFARDNAALEIRQQFQQVVVALQPLGVTVLPIVVSGLKTVVGLVSKLSDLFNTPVLGRFSQIAIGVAAVIGPLTIAAGKLRQIEQTFRRFQLATSVKGGFGALLEGQSTAQLAAMSTSMEKATTSVSLFGRAIGALPGLFSLAGAAGIAFFSGSALVSDNLTTKIGGIVGSLGSMILAFKGAQAAAGAFGIESTVALGGIGVFAAALAGGIAIWKAWETATGRSKKALTDFQDSLKGLTAEEAVKKFGATFADALKGITADDRVTQIETDELTSSLKTLGITGEDIGKKLADIVIANPDDIDAQKRAIDGLAKTLTGPIQKNSLANIQAGLASFPGLFDDIKASGNDALTNMKNNIGFIADEAERSGFITDETRDRIIALNDAGKLSFDGVKVSITDVDDAAAALGDTLQQQVADLLDQSSQAFRNARDAAIDATGAFTFATNSAGSFVQTVDDSGDVMTSFQSDIDDTVTSLSGLQTAFEKAVDAIFGLNQKVTVQKLGDNIADVIQGVKDDVTKNNDASTAPEDKINFQADVTGPDGQPVRQFVRDKISDIDGNIQEFVKQHPDQLDLALGIRDLNINELATAMGVSVESIQAILDADGDSTIDLKTELTAQDADSIAASLVQMQSLLDQAPLDVTVKTQIKSAGPDEQNALFGSKLIEQALQGNSKAVIDFVVNAEATGTSLDTLQALFDETDVSNVRSVVIQAIDEGQSAEKISGFLAGIKPEIRSQLILDVAPPRVTGDMADDDKFKFLFNQEQAKQLTINAIVNGADAVTTLADDVETPHAMPITTQVDDTELNTVTSRIDAGGTFQIVAAVDPTAFNNFINSAFGQIAALTTKINFARNDAKNNPTSENGGIFQGGGFRSFARGGTINGRHMRREPMIARAPRGMKGILWAEPQTHGEAYIPFNPKHRQRAEHILGVVAQKFDMALTKHGSISTAAHGGVVSTPFGGGGGNNRLASSVGRLATAVADRETQPLMGGGNTFVSQTTDPRATSRYLAEDVATVATRVMKS